eukprot:3761722-Amphidinium_carterae.1
MQSTSLLHQPRVTLTLSPLWVEFRLGLVVGVPSIHTGLMGVCAVPQGTSCSSLASDTSETHAEWKQKVISLRSPFTSVCAANGMGPFQSSASQAMPTDERLLAKVFAKRGAEVYLKEIDG